ncbi:MAG TPA: YwiC-like family protein [Verrucomicrobiae bacterium]|nr:YwiC-like family protein [Verrucomicrobiae bacterium]
MKSAAAIPNRFSMREIAKQVLPKEHGSWSLALEPIAFGMLAAPSMPGSALAVAAAAGFFLRRPLKILSRENDPERRSLALAAIFVLFTIAFGGLLMAIKWGGLEKLWPLIPAAAAGLAFAWFDSRNEGREGAAEIAGSFAFGILPAAFAVLAGWSVVAAFSLAVIMLCRSIPTVLFVRTFLRIKKGRAVSVIPAITSASAGFFLTLSFVCFKFAPWPAITFSATMTAGTIYLLAARPRLTAKAIGIAEAIFGTTMVLILAAVW